MIFFRNVMIYFDRTTQQEIVGKMCQLMHPGSWLFTAHAETLHGLDLPIDPVAAAVYVRNKRAVNVT